MNIGISLYFGFRGLGCELSVKKIKEANFDCVMTNADKRFKKDNGTIRKQVHYLKKYNLKLSSLHMQYRASDLIYFWQDHKIGDKLEKSIIKDLKIAHKYGFSCVVVHLLGVYSLVGVERLKRILKVARKVKVPLAVENIEKRKVFLEVMEKFKDEEYIKMCYDSGHNNAFDREYDYFEKFADKMIALHLHDNDGKVDMHTLNRFGTIDWDELAKKIARTKIENLDYELLLVNKPDMKMEDILKECYLQGVELANKIEEERKKLQDN